MIMIETLDILIKLATLTAILGGGGITLFKIGRMTQKFEQISVQQSKEISELKTGMSKVEGVLVAIANQGGRIDRIEDRVQAQGQRVDELAHRLNTFIDAKMLA